MKFVHRFTVAASLKSVADFHRHASSMAAITPPPVLVQMHEAPDYLQEGDEMEFTLWLLFIPIRWRARIENVTSSGFWDRQQSGPFGSWLHKHSFTSVAQDQTEVLDEIEAHPGSGIWSRLLSLGMWINMPLLFAYRAWRTKRLLERPLASQRAESAN